jgi:hypothetical protein
MKKSEARLDQIENEIHFRCWLRRQRILETMTAGELEAYAISGIWIDRPEPAFGTSRFDSMDRSTLLKMWKEEIAIFAGRDRNELEFYAVHGFWPEQDLVVPSTRAGSQPGQR